MAGSRSVLLIISGSVAAYKLLDVIRRLKERRIEVTTILTNGGQEFVTPLSVTSLLVAPASADILAKMANGQADDLATTTLLATDKPVMVAPAMNTKMWEHAATQRNIEQLEKDGIQVVPTGSGDLACGEHGAGRLAEVDEIVSSVVRFFEVNKPLAGKRALVTSGPTFEPIDPVRFIGNRSSGKQGHAIAQSLANYGADVTLVSGPVAEMDPDGVETIKVQTAEEMLGACEKSLPADIAVCAAAVSDWRVVNAAKHKMKKRDNDSSPSLELTQPPDILKTLSTHSNRPELVIGFAAETEDMLDNAKAKLDSKSCDWIIANQVSEGAVFDAEDNEVTIINKQEEEALPVMSKMAVANAIVDKIIQEVR
jgi:phosphopantothenoylcysteine decarboxylase/phosphopantothenate--cysteine ligase